MTNAFHSTSHLNIHPVSSWLSLMTHAAICIQVYKDPQNRFPEPRQEVERLSLGEMYPKTQPCQETIPAFLRPHDSAQRQTARAPQATPPQCTTRHTRPAEGGAGSWGALGWHRDTRYSTRPWGEGLIQRLLIKGEERQDGARHGAVWRGALSLNAERGAVKALGRVIASLCDWDAA